MTETTTADRLVSQTSTQIPDTNDCFLDDLMRIKPVDHSGTGLLRAIEFLKRHMPHAQPGYESSLVRFIQSYVAINHSNEFNGLLDTEGTLWEVNQAPPEEDVTRRCNVHGKPFWEYAWWSNSRENQEVLKEAIKQAASGKCARYDVEVLAGKHGSNMLTIDFNLNPIKDSNGNVVFLTAEGRDVTEKRRLKREAEESTRLSDARFRQIVDSNIIGVFSGRLTDGVITEANGYVLDMLGYTRDDLQQGQLNWRTLTPPEYEQSDALRTEEYFRTGILKPFEKQYFHKQGHRVDILLGGAFAENNREYFICYILDISAQKKAEAELADYAQRLEQSNKELEQFATIASHDLQEPLRKVLLFTDHLQKTERATLSDEGLDDLDRIQRAAKRMQRLITDLLNLSRITRLGKPFQKTDLNQVAKDVMTELSYAFPDVCGRVSVNGNVVIHADPDQIQQMLTQLLDNALKFHKPDVPSSVAIALQYLEGNYCQITISDNGIGMKPQHLSRVFDTFTRLHGREYDGTGIGLALVKKIVDRHGGHIAVHSLPGEGSTFTVTLPVQ